MCCGQTRSNLRANELASQSALNLIYFGYAAVNVRGPITGQVYQFSQVQPMQAVDARDADSILKTRLFRQTQ
jgi:hypothetical protein